jgi:hypothetical protein
MFGYRPFTDEKNFFVFFLLLCTACGNSVHIPANPPQFPIKTIYAAQSFDSNKIMETVRSFGANGVVIDIKNEKGEVTYAMKVPGIRTVANCIPDIKALLHSLKSNGIYVAGRIVAFKDSVRTDMCIKNKDGSLWIDKERATWLDPCDRKVWIYLKNIALQAAKDGFDEIQFDYVRFSAYQRADAAPLCENSGQRRADIINQFLDYIVGHIHSLGAAVSADVFGCIIEGTANTPQNLNTAKRSTTVLGQDYREIAKRVDYVCPMIYPSHYPDGAPFGIVHPDLEPYNVIRAVMTASANMSVDKKRVRPYLQAFTAKWLPHGQTYGRTQICEQIKAAADAGIVQWGLFNFSIDYP